MLKKIHDAVPARYEHVLALSDFETSIPPDILETWREAVIGWEQNADLPNPYKSDGKSTFCIF